MNTKMLKLLLLFITLLSIFLFTNPTCLAAGLPAYVEGQPIPSLAPMLERSMPAVVNISTTTNIEVNQNPLLQDPFFRQFFQIPNLPRQRQQKNSLGSGLIIDSNRGLVLTNNHVIAKADKIKVTLTDGRELTAKVIGSDADSDIAVIQIPAENLKQLSIADSSKLRVGDFVVAIGNPFGLGQTVTSGIVSALGRSGLGIEGYENFIQTDASINPGNSGGALVNLHGEFVGMNTAILAPSGGNVGIGFAIPSNMVVTIMNSLIKHGEVRRGLLGVTTQDLTQDLVNVFKLQNKQGAVVTRVENDSPAEKAGLEPGDVIITANNQSVKNSQAIRNIVGLMQIGDKVVIDYFHGNEKKSVTVTIVKPDQLEINGDTINKRLEGTLLTSSPKNQTQGILFAQINTSSYSWQIGIRPGDIILSINHNRIHNLDELKKYVNPNASLLITILRKQQELYALLQ